MVEGDVVVVVVVVVVGDVVLVVLELEMVDSVVVVGNVHGIFIEPNTQVQLETPLIIFIFNE